MAKKQEPREIRRGDGFVQERTRKDGSIGYYARWHDGAQMRGKTFETREAAEDHLRKIGRSKRRGAYSPESTLTVADWTEDYIDRGAHRWSANTVATYRLIRRQYIVPILGKTRLSALHAPQVQRWLDKLVGKKLSAAIVGNARSLLSGACDEAVKLGMITVNPVAGTRAPARPRGDKKTWSADDVARILAAIEDEDDAVTWRAFYLLALTTGMRPGELRAIQWGDIDLDAGIITIRRTMTRDADFRHVLGDLTKTGRARSVAIPPETVEALREQRADQRRRRIASGVWAKLDLVFDRGDGNPMAQQSVSNHHRRFCDRAKVERIRMHDLRHTAATLLLANNVHPKIVSEMLGHSSITVTMDTYSHVDVSMQRAASETLAETIFRRKKQA